MSSTYSIRFRLNYQAPGDNLNVWGTTLNTGVFQLLEDAIARRVALTVSGSVTLTSNNGASDQARCAFLDVTAGTGGTITAPSVEKSYIVRNGILANVIVSTGSGLSVTFLPGEVGWTVCDGTNFRKVQPTDFGGQQITSVADPTSPQGVATKNYADNLAFTANAGILPGQPGNAGKFLKTDATNALWGTVSSTDVVGLSASASVVRIGTSTTAALTPGDTYNALAEVTLTDAATIAVDMATFINGAVTLGGNRTLGNPTNPKPGQTGRIRAIQDGTGSRTLAMGSNWKRSGGATALTTTAGGIDVIVYDVVSGTYILYDLIRSPS